MTGALAGVWPWAAGAAAPVPGLGATFGFAQYVLSLAGAERVASVNVEPGEVMVKVSDTLAAEALVALLDLASWAGAPYRNDTEPGERSAGYSCWSGKAGPVEVFVFAPLAAGALPAPRPRNWPVSADDAARVLAGVA